MTLDDYIDETVSLFRKAHPEFTDTGIAFLLICMVANAVAVSCKVIRDSLTVASDGDCHNQKDGKEV